MGSRKLEAARFIRTLRLRTSPEEAGDDDDAARNE
jgi:hypothetical protein